MKKMSGNICDHCNVVLDIWNKIFYCRNKSGELKEFCSEECMKKCMKGSK